MWVAGTQVLKPSLPPPRVRTGRDLQSGVETGFEPRLYGSEESVPHCISTAAPNGHPMMDYTAPDLLLALEEPRGPASLSSCEQPGKTTRDKNQETVIGRQSTIGLF